MDEVEINGEYWIDDGSLQFADGDVGDYNHEGLAIVHIISSFSDSIIDLAEDLGIETDGLDFEGFDGVNPDAISEVLSEINEILKKQNNQDPNEYIMKFLGANTEALNVLYGGGDASFYVMKYEGWIAVRGMNIELYGYDENKRKSLDRGLGELLEQEGILDNVPSEEIDFSLYDHKTNRSSYLTYADIERQQPVLRPQQTLNTKGHSKFVLNTKDQTENIPFKNKSMPSPINKVTQNLGLIGPGQQFWRGTSETNMNFKEWFENAIPQKLDTNQHIQGIVQQYLSAFNRLLDNGASDDQANKAIETTMKQISYKWGNTAGEFFKNQALAKLKNVRSYQSAVKN